MALDLVVEKLEVQHVALLNIFKNIADEDLDYDVRLTKLRKSKEVLLAHLKQEDEEFYPVLREAAKEDKHLEWLLSTYDRIMETTVADALKFYDNYSDGWKHVKRHKFQFDLKDLMGLLQYRIEREESKLYPEYYRIQNMPKRGWFKKLF